MTHVIGGHRSSPASGASHRRLKASIWLMAARSRLSQCRRSSRGRHDAASARARGGGAAKASEVSETSEVWKAARDETQSLTEEIQRVEKEIDERVKGLYGL
jgi:hypothetical protein